MPLAFEAITLFGSSVLAFILGFFIGITMGYMFRSARDE